MLAELLRRVRCRRRCATRAAARPCSSATRCPTGGRARLAGLDEIDVPRYQRARQRLPVGADQPGEPAHDQLDVRRVPRPGPGAPHALTRTRPRAGSPTAPRSASSTIGPSSTTHAHRRRRPPPGRGLDAERPLAAALPGGLTANAFVPDTLSDLAGGAVLQRRAGRRRGRLYPRDRGRPALAAGNPVRLRHRGDERARTSVPSGCPRTTSAELVAGSEAECDEEVAARSTTWFAGRTRPARCSPRPGRHRRLPAHRARDAGS